MSDSWFGSHDPWWSCTKEGALSWAVGAAQWQVTPPAVFAEIVESTFGRVRRAWYHDMTFFLCFT
jgi:hypothetical protein